MFQLTQDEAELSRSQIAVLNNRRGSNIKSLPHAFTEHDAIQTANVQNSPRAVETGAHVVRSFVKLRELRPRTRSSPTTDELEARIEIKLTTHDRAIAAIPSARRHS